MKHTFHPLTIASGAACAQVHVYILYTAWVGLFLTLTHLHCECNVSMSLVVYTVDTLNLRTFNNTQGAWNILSQHNPHSDNLLNATM